MHIPARKLRFLASAVALMASSWACRAQSGDKALKAEADALFGKGEYAKAWPMYSQLVSLSPQDHELNYKFGACTIYGGDDKAKAIGYLHFAVGGPATPGLAWYFLGRAYQLDYRFDEALDAYNHYKGTADKKLLARFPVEALEQQCRNGKYLLSNLKDIDVLGKLEVDASDFFRFYDLSDIGGKIVVAPDELLSPLDRKSGERFLVYLPKEGGTIFFSSYGRDGKTGRDIYRTQLLPTGGYASPQKLAGYINTDQDEDFAVMAPDGKSFYFCSKGHNSMGGYDVFRSIYDSGMDVFSAPENMDFAVNTPADEMLYIVGPDGGQACFASDRDSRQGHLNVYRVSTTQTPINLTVLKGNYRSASGRGARARIIVEDELTRGRVAEVTSDENGDYVLVLPKGGRYKFLVEDGEKQRTYWAEMEVPAARQAQAFRQEIQLEAGAVDKLLVKNHFDEPLDGDVMALAMEEIRRRARLDVTGERPVAQEAPDKPRRQDPLGQAGFDGAVSMVMALEMAQEGARADEALGREQERQARAAMDLALANAGQAEALAQQAAAFVKQAGVAPTPAGKDQLMRRAGEARQRSEEAGGRARAAYRTGLAMQGAATRTRTSAQAAAALAAELAGAQAAKDEARLATALKQLKAGLDRKKGPEREEDELERMRREAASAAEGASQKMRQALAQRGEENVLADRIGRATQEWQAAKGGKKQELEAQLAVLREQHDALHEEVQQAFAKADKAEEEAAMARGQVELMKHLAAEPGAGTGTPPDPGALGLLQQRLDKVRADNEALVIDREYLPVATSPEERERRTFDWGTMDVIAGSVGTRTATRPAAPSAGAASGQATPAGEGAEGTQHAPEAARPGTLVQKTAPGQAAATGANGKLDVPVALTEGDGPAAGSARAQEEPDRAGDGSGTAGDAAQRAAGADGGMDGPPDEHAFMLANRLAELEQLRQAEKSRAGRDSLDREIAEQKARIEVFRDGGAEAAGAGRMNVPAYVYLAFDMATLDEELVEETFPGFQLARQAAMEQGGTERERAARLRTLELQLVDSIDAQTARALAYLEGHPEESGEVLPRLERWRRLKEEHIRLADQALAAAGQEYAAPETRALEAAQLSGQHAGDSLAPAAASSTPHNDAYVVPRADPGQVYASWIEPRSAKDIEALARHQRDLQLAEAMQSEIDSLENSLADVTASREHAKLRQRIDRKIDDLLIHQVDLGQRTAFISRSEYAVAKDSAKVLSRRLSQRGLAPDEPLVQMARAYEQDADAGMDRAKVLRRQADNVGDIFQRNSLYRQAYGEELQALRAMDRSHTVRNYLLGAQAVPGEALTYEEVEQRQFPEMLAGAVSGKEPGSGQEAPMPGPVTAAASPRDTASLSMASGTGEAAGAGKGLEHPAPAVVVARPVADSVALAGYLDKFYYMDAAERTHVLASEEEGRYFLMKGRAMQERADAVAFREEAEGAVELAAALRGEARTLRGQSAADTSAREPAGQVGRLEARADALMHRADSLQGAASRLAVAADAVDAQAATWMQALPADRSADLMALEQSRRRTEPVLARTRPRMQEGTAAEGAISAGPVTVRTTEPPAAVAGAGVDTPVVPPATRMAAPERIAPAAPAVNTAPVPLDKPLLRDVFVFQEAPAPRQEVIPIDAPLPPGIVYKVQVGAFRSALPLEAFSDMAPVAGERAANGFVRYTAGMFTSAESARLAGEKVRERGYRDAFVVAYMDGRRVPLREAMQAERARSATPVAAATTGGGTATAQAGTGGQAAVAPVQVPVANRPVDLADRSAQAVAEASVLAQYPATAEEVLAAFSPSEAATGYYNDSAAAPATQVETVKGLFFTVQVGVYSKPTALDRLFNITPLNSELTANGKIRYTTGFFLEEGQAMQRKNGTVALGVTDAFVTAYLNGKRIPLRDARALLAKFGRAILAAGH